MQEVHKPVLLQEVLTGLHIQRNKKYIDATFGLGGHGVEIAKRGGVVLGIETDPDTIRRFNEQGAISNEQIRIVHGNFSNLEQIAKEHGFNQVAGILFDLGYSSWQLDTSGRGFSFGKDEPLDMRLDPTQEFTAKDVINTYPVPQLEQIISTYGEEEDASGIARRMAQARPLQTTKQLRQLLESTKRGGDSRRSVARVFQAIRIEVNDELDSLKKGVAQAVELLEQRGRIAVISFHSLEDRIVKQTFQKYEGEKLRNLTKTPLIAQNQEISQNSRAKSAKLRIAEKL